FTITRGNNNHAYLDQDDDEAMDFGGSPDGGLGLDFDFPVDFSQHAQAYREAVTTNLFYGCNIIHDVLYRYGFDEASGNFQANNYGRGGQEGDYVRCEAADGSGTNNANFSTPDEDPGDPPGTPRMQMFLWPGNAFGRQNQVVVDGVGEFGAGWSRFGPPASPAGISGPIVLVNDGVATPPVGTVNDGCEPYGPLPAGAIAVVDRANEPPEPPEDPPPVCSFLEQVHNAEAAGAAAVVIANNTGSSNPPTLEGDMTAAPPGIPAVSVSTADGAALKAVLPGTGTVRKHPDHPGIRDGDFDTGIIFHEYGHGVSNRLTGGPTENCLGGSERGSEGWSDYYAISLLLNPELDDPEGTRGLVPYVLFEPDRTADGLRPAPYSRNMTNQPFTYDSIKSNAWLGGSSLSVPHGVGHGWAAILWDMTWDLINKHGFNPNVYEAWNTGGNNRAIQYVTEGLKLQGCFPGLVTSRSAIIAAGDELSEGEDTCMLWASFSRRGLGFSAVQGTSADRNDNSEAFDTHPDCRRGFQKQADVPYGTLIREHAGSTVPLKFTADGYTGLDVLKDSGSPFSRKVDCSTLQVPSQPEAVTITPREFPIAAASPGNRPPLTVNANGVYQFNWKTEGEWRGTCREFVLTRDDGKQHRAFFRFPG
ncbi:MAG: M36 family metallopeptidase, partial [Candidatus Rokuibacteriota bacterium]